jgi:hypothetical protein
MDLPSAFETYNGYRCSQGNDFSAASSVLGLRATAKRQVNLPRSTICVAHGDEKAVLLSDSPVLHIAQRRSGRLADDNRLVGRELRLTGSGNVRSQQTHAESDESRT